jgi:hypothetical protein
MIPLSDRIGEMQVTSFLAPEGAWASCFIEHLRVLHRLEFDAVRAYYVVAQSKFDFTGYMIQATDLYSRPSESEG